MKFLTKLLGGLKTVSFVSQVLSIVQIVVEAIEESEKTLGVLKRGQVPDYSYIVGLAYQKINVGNYKVYATEAETREALTDLTRAIFSIRRCFVK